MEFQHSYFEDEVREGFYVPGMVKRTWAAQMEVLADIDQVCRKHNIRWFADCGTLIGAIRHGGYIPWDDDMDICMTRDNYTKFLAVAEQELPEGYTCLNFYNDDKWKDFLTRVVNTKYINFEKKHLQKFHEFPFQTGVDIFPLDYMAPNEKEEEYRDNIINIVFSVANTLNEEKPLDLEMELQLKQVEELCNIQLNRNRPLKQQLWILADRLFSLYQPEESDSLLLMPYWLKDGSHKYPKECFEHAVMVPFENIRVPAPVMYDQVLEIEYYDYMTIVKGWGTHDYPYYQTQERILFERFGIELPHYAFTKKDLNKSLSKVKDDKFQKITDYVQSLSDIQENVCQCICTGNYSEAMDLLQHCQQCAIAIGNLIESLKGENFCTVEIVEEYCEQAYLIYQELVQSGQVNAEIAYQQLQILVEHLRNDVERNVKGRKEVVFLPFKAAMWTTMESAWRAAMEDQNCDVYVIPIPYFERHADGSFGKMYYAGDCYPDYVQVTDWQKYHLEERQPDVIIIQNPFDDCNCAMSVHPAFYAKQLKNCTEQLIYISPFETDEIEPGDEKAINNTQFYITMPGVVHADQVIVQSEKMRQTYIDVLTEFAGEETRLVWEKKILGAASSSQEKKKITKEKLNIPEEWKQWIVKEDGTYRKIILYHVSVSKLYQYKEQAIDKIHSVLSFFYEHRDDIILLWKPDELLQDSIDSVCPELGQEYREIVERYVKEEWGIYDGGLDWETTVKLCDAYYGDPSAIGQKFRNVGKPVMYQEIPGGSELDLENDVGWP